MQAASIADTRGHSLQNEVIPHEYKYYKSLKNRTPAHSSTMVMKYLLLYEVFASMPITELY